MGAAEVWHENERFWDLFQRFAYDASRIEAAEKEVEALLALAQVQPGARALDLCCGIGRHSMALAKRGFQVTGVDRTASYIDRASARAQRENLSTEFMQADMRRFTRPQAFDLVINMFTAFGYFEAPEQNLQVLQNVALSLRNGGTFVIDIIGKEILARIFQPHDWKEANGILMLEERAVQKDWSWIQARWIFYDGATRYEQDVSHWLYSAAELKAMCADAGFTTAAAYGALDGRPYAHQAQRLIIVALK